MKNTYINCELEYECPTENWLKLMPTESPKIKYCDKCAQKIYFCSDQNELNQRISEGAICVAFFKSPKKVNTPHTALAMGKLPEPSSKKIFGRPSKFNPQTKNFDN